MNLLEKLKRVREKVETKPNTTEIIFCPQHVVKIKECSCILCLKLRREEYPS